MSADEMLDNISKIMALEEELAEVTEQRDLVVADRNRLSKLNEELIEQNKRMQTYSDKLENELLWFRGYLEAMRTVFGVKNSYPYE